jgi:hypothetical protein
MIKRGHHRLSEVPGGPAGHSEHRGGYVYMVPLAALHPLRVSEARVDG